MRVGKAFPPSQGPNMRSDPGSGGLPRCPDRHRDGIGHTARSSAEGPVPPGPWRPLRKRSRAEPLPPRSRALRSAGCCEAVVRDDGDRAWQRSKEKHCPGLGVHGGRVHTGPGRQQGRDKSQRRARVQAGRATKTLPERSPSSSSEPKSPRGLLSGPCGQEGS